MEKAVEHVQIQFSTVRTGRAAPALVEKLHGRVLRLAGPAAAARRRSRCPRPASCSSSPHDRSSLGAIEKAIRDSDLGVNPSNDGVVIRLNFPPLTEERRKEYVKVVKHMAEDGRVAVRNLRRDARKHLEARREGRRDLGRRARAGREGAREDHPRPRRADRQGARPQGARAARGLTTPWQPARERMTREDQMSDDDVATTPERDDRDDEDFGGHRCSPTSPTQPSVRRHRRAPADASAPTTPGRCRTGPSRRPARCRDAGAAAASDRRRRRRRARRVVVVHDRVAGVARRSAAPTGELDEPDRRSTGESLPSPAVRRRRSTITIGRSMPPRASPAASPSAPIRPTTARPPVPQGRSRARPTARPRVRPRPPARRAPTGRRTAPRAARPADRHRRRAGRSPRCSSARMLLAPVGGARRRRRRPRPRRRRVLRQGHREGLPPGHGRRPRRLRRRAARRLLGRRAAPCRWSSCSRSSPAAVGVHRRRRRRVGPDAEHGDHDARRRVDRAARLVRAR